LVNIDQLTPQPTIASLTLMTDEKIDKIKFTVHAMMNDSGIMALDDDIVEWAEWISKLPNHSTDYVGTWNWQMPSAIDRTADLAVFPETMTRDIYLAGRFNVKDLFSAVTSSFYSVKMRTRNIFGAGRDIDDAAELRSRRRDFLHANSMVLIVGNLYHGQLARGADAGEDKLEVTLAKVIGNHSGGDGIGDEEQILVSYYRVPRGDINGLWVLALDETNKEWRAMVERGSIVMTGVVLKPKGTGIGRKLHFSTCEQISRHPDIPYVTSFTSTKLVHISEQVEVIDRGIPRPPGVHADVWVTLTGDEKRLHHKAHEAAVYLATTRGVTEATALCDIATARLAEKGSTHSFYSLTTAIFIST
jgi:hypothetical protein